MVRINVQPSIIIDRECIDRYAVARELVAAFQMRAWSKFVSTFGGRGTSEWMIAINRTNARVGTYQNVGGIATGSLYPENLAALPWLALEARYCNSSA